MESAACEVIADGMGLINSVAIAAVSTSLQVAFPTIISKVVDTPGNLILRHLEDLPALGLGADWVQKSSSLTTLPAV